MLIKIKKLYSYRTARISNSVKISQDFIPELKNQLGNHDVAIIRLKDNFENSSTIAVQASDGYFYIGSPENIKEEKW